MVIAAIFCRFQPHVHSWGNVFSHVVFLLFLTSYGQIKFLLCIEVTWAFVAKASFILWAILSFWLREGVRTVIQPLSTLVLLLSQFYCILCIITLWFGLRVLSWTNNQLIWCIHTHMSTPYQSTIHMCTLIIGGVLSFIECGQFGWLGALEVDFVEF